MVLDEVYRLNLREDLLDLVLDEVYGLIPTKSNYKILGRGQRFHPCQM